MGCASSSKFSPRVPGRRTARPWTRRSGRVSGWTLRSAVSRAPPTRWTWAPRLRRGNARAMVASFRQCMRKYRAEKVIDCDAQRSAPGEPPRGARGAQSGRAAIFRLVQRARRRCARRHGLDERECVVLAPSGLYDKARRDSGLRRRRRRRGGRLGPPNHPPSRARPARPTRRWTYRDQLKTRFDVNGDGVLRNASSCNSSPRTT